MRSATTVYTVCVFLLNSVTLLAQVSGEEILKKVEENFPGVQDYTVALDVTTSVERLNIPPMQVKMFFKQPDKFHFESDGFALLPREGLAFSAAKTLSRFVVVSTDEDSSLQRGQFRLSLRPKDSRAKVTSLVVYIDQELWKPTKVVSSFFGGRTITATFAYEKQDKYLMPSLLTVDLDAGALGDTSDQTAEMDMPQMPRSPMPRKGTVTIRYSDYEINTGLDDEIFQKK
jgi:outer membrane lipoprotein-sorting protein